MIIILGVHYLHIAANCHWQDHSPAKYLLRKSYQRRTKSYQRRNKLIRGGKHFIRGKQGFSDVCKVRLYNLDNYLYFAGFGDLRSESFVSRGQSKFLVSS